MKYPIYCYRDIKTGYMFPQCDQSDAAAMRGFAYAINKPEGIMNFAPKDYELYKVGEFDTETGRIETMIPKLIFSGMNAVGDKHD